jgi:hypothetical protein
MKSYTAQIIYRIKCNGTTTEQYDEQWRLIYAADEREALFQAKTIATQEEMAFVDRHGRAIAWELVAVKDIQEVALGNGVLLFSELKEAHPVASPVWADPSVAATKQTNNCH